MANPAFDIAYFITQSVEPDVQAAHEKDLMRAYYKKLTSSGVSAEEFPWEQFLYHYQLGLAFCFMYPVFAGESTRPSLLRTKAVLETR